jgi:hypothetical protein
MTVQELIDELKRHPANERVKVHLAHRVRVGNTYEHTIFDGSVERVTTDNGARDRIVIEAVE